MIDENPDQVERLIEDLFLDRSRILWVDPEFSGHIETVLRRLPEEILMRLVEQEFRFLAPQRGLFGRVTRFDGRIAVGQSGVFVAGTPLPSTRRNSLDYCSRTCTRGTRPRRGAVVGRV